jgi:hypothetical protein
MGIVSRAADTYYAYRFVKILSTPWDEMDAYEFGIIDENGKVLRKSRTLRTSEEKSDDLSSTCVRYQTYSAEVTRWSIRRRVIRCCTVSD